MLPRLSFRRRILAESAPIWVPPTLESWAKNYRKHHPFFHRKDWKKVVRETLKPPRGKSEAVARYIHDPDGERILTIKAIQKMEFDAVSGKGNEIPTEGPVKDFWMKMDRIIGASMGEETIFIRVELTQSGTYHGRPITARQLNEEGVDWNLLK